MKIANESLAKQCLKSKSNNESHETISIKTKSIYLGNSPEIIKCLVD